MTLKLIGVVLIIVGCGGVGFLIAASHKKEVKTLRQLISALDYMQCELEYRMPALPELCRQAAQMLSGPLKSLFIKLALEMDNQIAPNVEKCMFAALEKSCDIPRHTKRLLQELGSLLGCFDITGQIKGLETIRTESSKILNECSKNQDVRMRSYQTLGICAGAAIAILLV